MWLDYTEVYLRRFQASPSSDAAACMTVRNCLLRRREGNLKKTDLAVLLRRGWKTLRRGRD